MKWLADENFDNGILRGIRRRQKTFDVVRVQDIPEISGAEDPEMLAWATIHARTVLTHDLSTIIPAMRIQLRRAGACAKLLLVPDRLAAVIAIEDILLLDECSNEADWAAGVLYLPLS